MNLKLLQSFIIAFVFTSSVYSQIKYVSFGTSAGIGGIKGNSPSVTSAGFNFYADLIPWFSEGSISIRTGFFYSQKVEKFLPENRAGRYYPFLKSFWIKGMLKEILDDTFYLEQGVGIIYLNDRTFNDTNFWEPGVSFDAVFGMDLRKNNSPGISIGGGLDYGITFTATAASYYLFYIQLQYYP